MNPECPKCGERMTGPRYHKTSGDCGFQGVGTRGEHLHYYCVCGFSLTRPTKDAEAHRA